MADDTSKEVPQVGEMDSGKKNSEIFDDPGPAEAKAIGEALCWYNGVQYGPGAEICSGNVRLRCNAQGWWRRVGRC